MFILCTIIPIIALIITIFYDKQHFYMTGLSIISFSYVFGSFTYGLGLFAYALPLLLLLVLYFSINVLFIDTFGMRKISKVFYCISSMLLLAIPFFGVGAGDGKYGWAIYGLISGEQMDLSLFFPLEITVIVSFLIVMIIETISLVVLSHNEETDKEQMVN